MSAPTAPGHSDSPAVALGPTSLVFGIVSAAAVWPTLTFVLLPWSILAGGLAVTFGLTGMHYARQGVGRMWSATAGTALGATGLTVIIGLLTVLAG